MTRAASALALVRRFGSYACTQRSGEDFAFACKVAKRTWPWFFWGYCILVAILSLPELAAYLVTHGK